MGGEKMNKRYEEGRKPGSPPRGRGKVIAQRHALFGVGITPAWAGKSQSSFRAVLLHGDYPRVGGEKGSYRWVIKSVKGSPPHGRGKVRGRKPFLQEPWITPAWAGKSMTAPGRSSRTGDHPRVGGEKNNHIIDNQYGKGSPPRRRGKGGKSFTGNMFTRITPAWAGKRGRFAERKAPSWDHPRMGGEKKKSRRCCTSIGGSPPHGRGKARHLSHGLLPCG